jgi:hypothetical protein
MIKEPNMSVEQPHSLGAVLKGAILLIFFVFGVTTYAQSYNAPISYRVSGTTQSTASAEQWNGGGVANGQATSGVYGAADGGYQPAGKAGGYNVNNGFGGERSNYRSVVETDMQQNAYKAYQGSVYEPFNDTPPSEAGGKGISGRKNAFPGRPDTGQSKDSPVGEPFVLLLFAAVAVVVAWRQKRPTPALPRGKE